MPFVRGASRPGRSRTNVPDSSRIVDWVSYNVPTWPEAACPLPSAPSRRSDAAAPATLDDEGLNSTSSRGREAQLMPRRCRRPRSCGTGGARRRRSGDSSRAWRGTRGSRTPSGNAPRSPTRRTWYEPGVPRAFRRTPIGAVPRDERDSATVAGHAAPKKSVADSLAVRRDDTIQWTTQLGVPTVSGP